MNHTEEIILDIIKYMELEPDMIDILEDNNGNITIVDYSGMSPEDNTLN